YVFFFSSRRRHTRWPRDWSSDVCSSDLRAMETFASQRAWNDPDVYWISLVSLVDWICNVLMPVYAALQVAAGALRMGVTTRIHQIGRASCRERVKISECAGAVYIKSEKR